METLKLPGKNRVLFPFLTQDTAASNSHTSCLSLKCWDELCTKARLRSSFSTTVAREARISGNYPLWSGGPCIAFFRSMLPKDPTV